MSNVTIANLQKTIAELRAANAAFEQAEASLDKNLDQVFAEQTEPLKTLKASLTNYEQRLENLSKKTKKQEGHAWFAFGAGAIAGFSAALVAIYALQHFSKKQ